MYLITRDSLSGDLELQSRGGLGEGNVKEAELWQEQRLRPPSICKDHRADECLPSQRGRVKGQPICISCSFPFWRKDAQRKRVSVLQPICKYLTEKQGK